MMRDPPALEFIELRLVEMAFRVGIVPLNTPGALLIYSCDID
jgi:hypothetical protein